MKRFLLSLAALPLAGCTVHFHVHEVSREVPPPPPAAPEAPAPPHEPPAETTRHAEATETAVTGIVVDESGQPLRARVAAIGTSGSVSNATNAEGRFELTRLHWPEFTLHASTDDDLVGIATGVLGNSKDVKIVVRPAASVSVRLADEDPSRCAFFHHGARIEDFTLRPGKPSRVVLPSGDVHIRLYQGEEIRAERDLHLAVGQHVEIELASAAKPH